MPEAKKLRVSKGSSPGRSGPPVVGTNLAARPSSSGEARPTAGTGASLPNAEAAGLAASATGPAVAGGVPHAPDSPADDVLQAISPTESPGLPGPAPHGVPAAPQPSLPRPAFSVPLAQHPQAGLAPVAASGSFQGSGSFQSFQRAAEIHPAPPRWGLQASQQAPSRPPLLSASLDASGRLGRISSAVRPPAAAPLAKALKQGAGVFPQGALLATLQPAPTVAAQEVRLRSIPHGLPEQGRPSARPCARLISSCARALGSRASGA